MHPHCGLCYPALVAARRTGIHHRGGGAAGQRQHLAAAAGRAPGRAVAAAKGGAAGAAAPPDLLPGSAPVHANRQPPGDEELKSKVIGMVLD